jgi:branched-subunit amino acid transport protein
MSLITWMMRALPFLGGHSRLNKLTKPDTPLSVLGPSLLAAICVAVIFPDLLKASDSGIGPPYIAGLAATIVIACEVKNAGLAVLSSVTAYGALLYLFT